MYRKFLFHDCIIHCCILVSWVLQVGEHTSVNLCYFSFKLKIPRQALNDNVVNFYSRLVACIIISIRLNSLHTSCFPYRSSSAADAWKLPAPESNSARHWIPPTLTTTAGYVTEPRPVATNMCSGFRGSLSQIEEWCLLLQNLQVEEQRLSESLCFMPVQLKHNCLSFNCFLRSLVVVTLSQLTDWWLQLSQ